MIWKKTCLSIATRFDGLLEGSEVSGWLEPDRESALSWYLQVEGWGCRFVQSENPCFGTCTKLGTVNKNLSDLGLSLVPVTDHKPFPAPHHSSLYKSYSVLVLGGQAGSRLFDTLPAVIWMWALTPPVSWRWRLRPQLRLSPKAGGWPRWQLRDSAECAETELSLTGEGELSKADWQHGFSKWTSKRNVQVLVFPYLPTGHYFRSLLLQPFAERHASLVGSCCVHLVDYSARTMKFAKSRLVFKCREEEREDACLYPAVNGW